MNNPDRSVFGKPAFAGGLEKFLRTIVGVWTDDT
jgi:hypothetical protein